MKFSEQNKLQNILNFSLKLKQKGKTLMKIKKTKREKLKIQ